MDSPTQHGQPHNTDVASTQNRQQICQLCHEHLFGNSINCDTCDKPYHLTCAKISHHQESWLCPDQHATHISPSTHSSIASKDSISRKKSLELKKLEEERELATRRDQEYLYRKYQILQQLEEEDADILHAAAPNQIVDATNNTVTQPNLTALNASIQAPATSNNIPLMSTATEIPSLNHNYNTNNITDFRSSKFIYPNLSLHSTFHPNHTQPNPGHTQNRNTTFINARQTETSQQLPEHPIVSKTRLTSDQLHARQTVPKELPYFSGCPEEWPLFSSTYDWSTSVCGLTDGENLIRLQRALRGEALEAVKRILVHPSCVPHAISTLKLLYGQPEKIIFSLKNKIKTLPQVNPNKMETITNFAIQVKGLQSTIEACGLKDELNNSSMLQELVSKLPPYYQIIWGSNKLNLQQNNKKANLVEFANWIFDIGLSASTVNIEKHMTAESVFHRKQKNVFVHTYAETNKNKCHVCSGDCKNISNCRTFISADRNKRWNFVKIHSLCKHCLRKHNGVCFNKDKSCNVKGCQLKHHYLHHKYDDCESKQTNSAKETNEREKASNSVQNLNTHDIDKQKILFKVIPIRIYGKNNKVVSTYAFLDDGSSISLIEEDILKQLDLKGEAEQLCLKWTGNIERVESNSQRLTVQVSGNNNKQFGIDVRTVKELMLPKQTLDYEFLCRKFNYLKGLPIESYSAATPKVLIGLNNLNITISTKIKEGGKNEPIGLKTALGWTVFGPCGSNESTQYSMHICECIETDNKIQQLVKQYFKIESLGINCQSLKANKEDERSLQLLNKFTKQCDDMHYETCLLWQNDEILLPNNYQMAKNRLFCLEKQLLKNKELFEVYSKTIQDYINKGYISKIDVATKAKRVWYLPTFPVYNKNKPGKCRIVWDAAAKFNGISLNSVLYKGPDLLASLQAILFQFRERSVALCGDIEQMFHQVLRPYHNM